MFSIVPPDKKFASSNSTYKNWNVIINKKVFSEKNNIQNLKGRMANTILNLKYI